MKLHNLLLLISAVLSLDRCYGSRIAVLYTTGSKSHFYAVWPLVEELGERGHQVTVFTPFKGITKNTKNINEIILPTTAKTMAKMDIDWFGMQKEGTKQLISMMIELMDLIVIACEELLANPEFRRIVDQRDVDLFITDSFLNEFSYPIIDKIGVPFVIHSSTSAAPISLYAMGAPTEYATVPTMLIDTDKQMSFFTRMVNVLLSEMLMPFRGIIMWNKLNSIIQREFPGVRSMEEVEGEPSLFLINSHPVTNWPRSLPPNIIPIGPLHTRPARPLSQEFQVFADEASDGFVVFSLGSFVPVSSMPKEMLETFIQVFAKIPQKIVWKWEAEKPKNIPPNVLMVDWIPQQDLLGHPNAKLLITHGGMLGTQETIYHGVPLLGLPFGNDQKANVGRAVRDGWGRKLDWDQLDDQNLYDAITYLVNDPGVRKNVTRISRMMKDDIVTPREKAAYWVEYVLRHGDTRHLQLSSKGMPFYQRHLLDVVAFLMLIGLLLGILGLYISYKMIRKCCKKNSSQKIKRN